MKWLHLPLIGKEKLSLFLWIIGQLLKQLLSEQINHPTDMYKASLVCVIYKPGMMCFFFAYLIGTQRTLYMWNNVNTLNPKQISNIVMINNDVISPSLFILIPHLNQSLPNPLSNSWHPDVLGIIRIQVLVACISAPCPTLRGICQPWLPPLA